MKINPAIKECGCFKTVLPVIKNGFIFFLIAALLSFVLYVAGNFEGWSGETLFMLLHIISAASIILFFLAPGGFVLNFAVFPADGEKRRLRLIAGPVFSALAALALAVFSNAVIVITGGNIK